MPDAPYLFASRILVVDDVLPDARCVEEILRTAGYTDVTTATDPMGVGKLHREHRYDLVILDLVMPERSGYEVMADIAAIEARARLPVLAMTEQSGDLQRALASGARDLIAKPIQALELRARVRNLLEVQLALRALERRGVELARDQEMLREAEEHYRALVEQTLVGIYIMDRDRLIYANRRLRDLLGYSDGELARLKLADILSTEDHPLIEMIANRRRAGERDAIAVTCRVRSRNGNLLHWDVESRVIDLAGRKATMGVVLDVTDRKRAADALRASEETYRTLWETSSDVVILMNEGMRIQYANASMARVFGYAPEEVQGRHISMLQPERLREAHRVGMERYMRTGKRTVDWRGIEATGLRRDGHEFPLEIAFSELTIGGSSVFAGFMRDITERRRAQEALQAANRRLEVLSDRVLAVQEEERRFIASELHDDVGQSLLALQLGMHRLSKSSGNAAARLLEECVQILQGVQEKLRQLSVRLHPPQLAQLGLQEALIALVSRQRETTGLDIRCSCEGPEPGILTPELETAAYRICQEALSNATRHSGARHVEVRTKLEDERFCLSVSDDGSGFDAAVQGEAASDAGRMGLISMEERARLAGGSLELVTAPGAGTVVIAMFPRPPARAPHAPAPLP